MGNSENRSRKRSRRKHHKLQQLKKNSVERDSGCCTENVPMEQSHQVAENPAVLHHSTPKKRGSTPIDQDLLTADSPSW
jgi:hypothetical protein